MHPLRWRLTWLRVPLTGWMTSNNCQELILMHPFLLCGVHGDDIITFCGSSFMFPINTVRGFVFED